MDVILKDFYYQKITQRIGDFFPAKITNPINILANIIAPKIAKP